MVLRSGAAAWIVNHASLGEVLMGDRSPKSNDRKNKQHAAEKERKQAAALAKAHPTPAVSSPKSK